MEKGSEFGTEAVKTEEAEFSRPPRANGLPPLSGESVEAFCFTGEKKTSAPFLSQGGIARGFSPLL